MDAPIHQTQHSTSSTTTALNTSRLTWVACIYPVANVKQKPAELKGTDIVVLVASQYLMSCAAIIGILEKILQLLRER